MEIITERSKELSTYIKNNPTQEEKDLKEPVFLGGENAYLPVFRIPIKLLIFNIRNGRFAAELLEKEKEIGRTLDATNENDAKILQKLLLDQNPSETEVLKASLKAYGQLQPGLVTFDGAVVNANRRMAVLSQLHSETGDDKFAYLKVAVLKKEVSEKDLWRIEAGLQFAKDLRLDYGPVNELLKLREGVRSGLTYPEISNSLGGRYTAKEVEGRLKILGLIDNYLDSISKPKEYMLFQGERKVEQFNSLQDNVLTPLLKKLDKKEVATVIPLAFRLIESEKVNYLDIRKLKGIMLEKAAYEVVIRGFNPEDRKTQTLHRLAENFEVAKEIVDAKKEHGRPKYLVERAIALVSDIDLKHKAVRDEEVVALLKSLRAKIDKILS